MSDQRRMLGMRHTPSRLNFGLEDAATRRWLSRFKRRDASDQVDVA